MKNVIICPECQGRRKIYFYNDIYDTHEAYICPTCSGEGKVNLEKSFNDFKKTLEESESFDKLKTEIGVPTNDRSSSIPG